MVVYTFRVCDEWHAEREEVRRTLGNPFVRSAYFCKVELGFALPPGKTEEAAKKAAEDGKRFLAVALPVLVRDHWPDWNAGKEETRPAANETKPGRP